MEDLPTHPEPCSECGYLVPEVVALRKRCERLESVLALFFRVTARTKVTGNFWRNLKCAGFWEKARAALDGEKGGENNG